jgi:hypothetical protein
MMRLRMILAGACFAFGVSIVPAFADSGGASHLLAAGMFPEARLPEKVPTILKRCLITGQAQRLAKELRDVYASTRRLTISACGPDVLVVRASAEDHLHLFEEFRPPAGPPAWAEVIHLGTLDAVHAVGRLKAMFRPAGPYLVADAACNCIAVRGTKAQIAAVKRALRALGDRPAQARPSASPAPPA